MEKRKGGAPKVSKVDKKNTAVGDALRETRLWKTRFKDFISASTRNKKNPPQGADPAEEKTKEDLETTKTSNKKPINSIPHIAENSNRVNVENRKENRQKRQIFDDREFSLDLLKKVKPSGAAGNGEYMALCPAHNDTHHSLSVSFKPDKILVNCHAGCATENVMKALGLTMSALFYKKDKPYYSRHNPKAAVTRKNQEIIPTAKDEINHPHTGEGVGYTASRSSSPPKTTTYDYKDENNQLLYHKKRFDHRDGSKTFGFYAPSGKKGVQGIQRVPYNLPQIASADVVYFVEGEKAADAVIKAGYVATSLDAGANSKWRDEYGQYFEGKEVIILPDNDEPGMKYAMSIASHIAGARIVQLPGLAEKGDAYDWLAAGHSMDEIAILPSVNLPSANIDLSSSTASSPPLTSSPSPASVVIIDPTYFAETAANAADNFLPCERDFLAINPFGTQDSRNLYRWNDVGIGNLFADCYKNLSRFVPESKLWYFYDGRVWRPDVGGVVIAGHAKRFMNYLLVSCIAHLNDEDQRSAWAQFVAKRMRRQARENMIADAASCWPLFLHDFDKDPFIFNCGNCTLDLRDFSVHNHRSEDFLSKISNVDYDENARCERWEKFTLEVMNDDADKARFLQKALGYTLTGDTSEECFFILHGGTTRNGKGTTMETTLQILGDYGRTAQPETVAQKSFTNGSAASEDIARLKGARFVNMSEPEKGLRLNAALVKQVTGGDTVTARFLHQNSFEYRPQYKLFINTNHLPRVSDDSIFASGRVKLIPFERHFDQNSQDKGLKAFFKEPANKSGIFNWFIEGLRLMKAEGLEQPQSMKAATDDYRRASDPIGQFVSEYMVAAPGHKVTAKEVHAEYINYCEGYGYSPFNNRNLIAELRNKGIVVKNGTGNKVYIYDYGVAHDAPPPPEFVVDPEIIVDS